eukprot:TCONS_00071868-protein
MRLLAVILLVTIAVDICSTKHHHRNHHQKLVKEDSNTVKGHVRSLSSEDDIENENTGQKRTVYESLQEQFPIEKRRMVARAYREVLSNVLEAPSDDSAFDGIGPHMIAILEVFQRNGGDIFKQVRKKMDISPKEFYQTIIAQNVDDIKDIIDNKKVTKPQWIGLKANKYRFMPASKHYSSAEYTRDFFADIMAFTIVYVGATLDLAFKGDVYECELAKELDLLKNDIETSVQVLIYKRLKMLEPHSSDWKWMDITYTSHDKIQYKDTYLKKLLCEEGGCELRRDGREPIAEKLQEVAKSVTKDALPMFDFLNKFLELLSTEKEFCFKSCLCPPEDEPIKMEQKDYVVEIPWGCLGKPVDKSKDCMLVCGKYGEKYDWCPTQKKTRASSWSKCKQANFERCIEGWYK